MLHQPLTNLKCKNIFKMNLDLIVTYVINLDDCKSIGTYWIVLYVNYDNITNFDSFGIEHTAIEIKKIIGNKNIITNIDRIQVSVTVMCGYVFIGFISFMLKVRLYQFIFS